MYNCTIKYFKARKFIFLNPINCWGEMATIKIIYVYLLQEYEVILVFSYVKGSFN